MAHSFEDTLLGEALVGEGPEIAHIDLVIGRKGSSVEQAFMNALAPPAQGHTPLLAVLEPNLPAKPYTLLVNKVTIKRRSSPSSALWSEHLRPRPSWPRRILRSTRSLERCRDPTDATFPLKESGIGCDMRLMEAQTGFRVHMRFTDDSHEVADAGKESM